MAEHLKSISFKILSDEEITKLSTFDAQKALEEKQEIKVILQDPRLGGQGPTSYCGVCNLKGGQCLGHESYVDLALPVLNPGARNIFKEFIKNYCFSCGHFKVDKKKKCSNCEQPKPTLAYANPYTFYIKNDLVKIDELYQKLKKIPASDTREFFKKTQSTVESFFISKLVIPAVNIRPKIVYLDKMYEDDLSKKLETILQVNEKLKQMIKVNLSKSGILEMHRLLQYHVFTYFDNKTPRVPTAVYKNGTPLKSLLQRIESKEGIFRSNLAGKRTDFAMRAVLTGDSFIKVDEVGISKGLAMLLTKPVVIDKNNIDEAKTWVNGEKGYIKATYYEYRTQEGSFLKLKITDANKEFITENLTIGSIIHRSLMTGDWVVFNRQPTLHRYGIMAHKLIVYDNTENEGNTIRLNPSSCPSYNADFDGDEGNIIPPKSKEAEIDMALLMSVKANILDTKKGNPIIGLTKELLTAACGLSLTQKKFKKSEIVDLFGSYAGDILEEGKLQYTNKQILSNLLPKGFYYKDEKEDGIKVEDGVFISGLITKRNFSNSSPLMCQLSAYLGDRYWDYILKMLKVFRSYYKYMKHSIAYDDYLLFLKDEKRELTKKNYQKHQLLKIEEVNEVFKNLDKQEILKNPVLTMTEANSSGSLIGISQLTKSVGEKKIRCTEIGTFFNGCYPEYTQNKENSDAYSEAELLKKGYISSNYLEGLTFSEYITDATHARDTNLDNQLNVSTLGYFNRRVTNALADVISVKEGFLEDGSKNIIQYEFGGCNADLVSYKPKVLSEQLIKKIDELSLTETEDKKVITIKNIKKVLENTYGVNSNRTNILLANFKSTHKLTIPQLIELGQYITTPVGSPIGITTAHAYGQPATQMTLNAKHDVTGLQSRFARLLELTERIVTKTKVNIKVKEKQDLKRIKDYVSAKKLSSLITLHLDQNACQIVLLGDLKVITTKLLNIIKEVLRDYDMTKVKESNSKALNSLVFTNKDRNSTKVYKDYLKLKNLDLLNKKANYLPVSETECYLQGNKGSVSLYGIVEELKDLIKGLEIDYFDPLYYAKVYGIEGGRKLLYKEFTKFVNEGLDIDSRYFSLFCDLVTTRGVLLPLGRNGVLNYKPPLAKLAYEAAKSGVFELAFSNKKDYLQNPYSCLITNTPLKIGADYFEIYL